jgi:transcriptional regulator with XRE-family HTH domain
MIKSPNQTDKRVGSRVRMRRLMLGMSQTELADAIGITFQQVQKYEKGTNRVSASRLQQIARVLRAPVSYFFDDLMQRSRGSKDIVELPEVEALMVSSGGLSLVRAFTRIRQRKLRRRIIELVEELGTR